MNKVKTIIVDDEAKAREGLSNMLFRFEEIDLISSCKNGLEAIDVLNKERIDLVFLDVQMPGISGFDVLSSISEPKPLVVFVTAFDQYAIKAFDNHALDYLLKPFSDDRFNSSVLRSLDIIRQQRRAHQIHDYTDLLEYLSHDTKNQNSLISNTQKNFQKLIFRCDGRIILLPYDDILWVEGYDYYIKIHSKEGIHLLKESLKGLLTKLPEEFFIRVHKSAIINVNKVNEIAPLGHNDYELLMQNKDRVRVSRKYKSQLLVMLNMTNL